MNFLIRESYLNDYHRIHRFMKLVNDDFNPPLDEREINLQERIQNTLYKPDSGYLILESQTIDSNIFIIGLIGFDKFWMNEKDAYINFLAIHPEYRGLGLSSKLERELVSKLEKEGIQYINVCTWSTNKPVLNFYEKMNYQLNHVLKNDRGDGIDTIYYCKCL